MISNAPINAFAVLGGAVNDNRTTLRRPEALRGNQRRHYNARKSWRASPDAPMVEDVVQSIKQPPTDVLSTYFGRITGPATAVGVSLHEHLHHARAFARPFSDTSPAQPASEKFLLSIYVAALQPPACPHRLYDRFWTQQHRRRQYFATSPPRWQRSFDIAWAQRRRGHPPRSFYNLLLSPRNDLVHPATVRSTSFGHIAGASTVACAPIENETTSVIPGRLFDTFRPHRWFHHSNHFGGTTLPPARRLPEHPLFLRHVFRTTVYPMTPSTEHSEQANQPSVRPFVLSLQARHRQSGSKCQNPPSLITAPTDRQPLNVTSIRALSNAPPLSVPAPRSRQSPKFPVVPIIVHCACPSNRLYGIQSPLPSRCHSALVLIARPLTNLDSKNSKPRRPTTTPVSKSLQLDCLTFYWYRTPSTLTPESLPNRMSELFSPRATFDTLSTCDTPSNNYLRAPTFCVFQQTPFRPPPLSSETHKVQQHYHHLQQSLDTTSRSQLQIDPEGV
ncbi:hypothetical protein FRC05_002248 [Tulasnella sp. 425]|nr:hypothetical protein FRC05_002248 [Tulasnella sp. 425]